MDKATADLVRFAAAGAGKHIAQRLEATELELGFALVVFEHGDGDALFVANVENEELQPVLEGLARALDVASTTPAPELLAGLEEIRAKLLAASCSQCGQTFGGLACGPTHAAIAAQAGAGA